MVSHRPRLAFGLLAAGLWTTLAYFGLCLLSLGLLIVGIAPKLVLTMSVIALIAGAALLLPGGTVLKRLHILIVPTSVLGLGLLVKLMPGHFGMLGLINWVAIIPWMALARELSLTMQTALPLLCLALGLSLQPIIRPRHRAFGH